MIYIATVDGQIIKTDISLNIMDRRKYKYAKFYALAYGYFALCFRISRLLNQYCG